MASNTYVPLNSASEFGKRLIQSGDLDPIYIMLHEGLARGILDTPTLKRWLLAYWMFYHAGTASTLSELDHPNSNFWPIMMKHYQGEGQWPRGAERRHFRGKNGIDSIAYFSTHPAEYWVDSLLEARSFGDVQTIVKPWPAFGPWITFKIADMLERLELAPIEFHASDILIYEEPRKGAALVMHGDPEAELSPLELGYAIGELERMLRGLPPPPIANRTINVQEVETVLCKFKSHYKGHYWVGKDCHEIREGLAGWGSTAYELQAFVPELKFEDWNTPA